MAGRDNPLKIVDEPSSTKPGGSKKQDDDSKQFHNDDSDHLVGKTLNLLILCSTFVYINVISSLYCEASVNSILFFCLIVLLTPVNNLKSISKDKIEN